MNLLVIREYISTSEGKTKIDFLSEVVKKNGLVRPKGCAGIRFKNLSDTEVYVDNVILEAKEEREFRSKVPICELTTQFRVNETIVGASEDVSGYSAPPMT